MSNTIDGKIRLAQGSAGVGAGLDHDEDDEDNHSHSSISAGTASSTEKSAIRVADDHRLAIEGEGEGEVEGDGEGEGEDDDYSSTSSGAPPPSNLSLSDISSTPTELDNTRVCDCCYCEVYGDRSTTVAPTSRNLQETRERLRQKWHRRRAERCEQLLREQQHSPVQAKPDDGLLNKLGADHAELTGGCPDTCNHSQQRQQQQQPHKQQQYALMGDSSIEEILNFINGSSREKSASNVNKKKDKSKNANKRNNKNKSSATTAINSAIQIATSNNRESKDSEKCQLRSHRVDSDSNSVASPNTSPGMRNTSPASAKKHRNNSNNSNACPQAEQCRPGYPNSPKNKSSSEAHCRRKHSGADICCNSTDHTDQPDTKLSTAIGQKQPKKREKVPVKLSSDSNSNNGKQQLNKVPSQGKAISPARNPSSRESNKANVASASHIKTTASDGQQNVLSTITQNNRRGGGNLTGQSNPPSSTKAIGNKASSFQESHESSQRVATNGSSFDRTFTTLNANFLEDVFKPRDVDLNDIELDEFEKELEAFKRFCLDSISLVKKERVRIKLKDPSWFRDSPKVHRQSLAESSG